ncbi:EamA family transporter [Cohnella cellulosilytica]|uniref:EamA family transporter n=1 Tax=Cohnella cellulosilytica TaxID=986710 RepID=A0ABW2F1E7_9BACL
MKYKLSVLLGAVCYGILSTIVTKAYAQGYSLGEVVGSQLLTGFVLAWALTLLMRVGGRNARRRPETGTATIGKAKLGWKQRLLLMAAGTPTAVTGLLYYESLHYIPNSLAILLLFQFTWIGVLMQAVARRQRPGGAMLLTVAVLLGGTIMAAGVIDQGMAGLDWRGVAFGLASALSYSLFILFSGKAVPSVHPAARSAWMITGGMLLVFVLFPPAFLFNGVLWSGLLPFGLLLGLFGAFLPPVLYAIGVPRIGEALTGILGASELPVAVLLAAVVLREHVSVLQWAGVAVVLLGVALPELLARLSRKSVSILE